MTAVSPAHAPARPTVARGRTHVSAIYEGVVTHERRMPAHAFRARLFLMYLDLAELPALFDCHPLWSARGRGVPARFDRADYLGDPGVPLDEAVRDLVQERLGTRPQGPVRMLAHLRMFGHCINPVAFYWCFDPAGERVEAVVAEVTNTPWGDRHAYVALADGNAPGVITSEHDKALHVSPLMPMDMRYRWSISVPGERIAVTIENERAGERVFAARLALRRRAISRRSLTAVLARHPLMTLSVRARIYSQALRLKLKGARWHARPKAAA